MDKTEIITLAVAFFGSVGFWQFINNIWQSKREKKNNQYDVIEAIKKGVLALLHSELYELCDTIIEQGYKTSEQVEKLTYMTAPYFRLGGDGTLEKLLKIIDGLPIKKV